MKSLLHGEKNPILGTVTTLYMCCRKETSVCENISFELSTMVKKLSVCMGNALTVKKAAK
jgi:hypothetical protein